METVRFSLRISKGADQAFKEYILKKYGNLYHQGEELDEALRAYLKTKGITVPEA